MRNTQTIAKIKKIYKEEVRMARFEMYFDYPKSKLQDVKDVILKNINTKRYDNMVFAKAGVLQFIYDSENLKYLGNDLVLIKLAVYNNIGKIRLDTQDFDFLKLKL